MDKNTLVDNLRKMSNKIIDDRKSVSLIMLLGNNTMQETTSFDYIISAGWLNDFSQDEGMDLVLDYLYDNLSSDDLKHVSRVTIMHTNDSIVQNMSRNMGVQGGVSIVIDCRFGNLIIPYAIIFESRYENT